MSLHTVPTSVQRSLLEPCARLSLRSHLGLGDLCALAARIDVDADERAALQLPDPSRPYGRRVLMATDLLEVMIATWTRGVPCAPHDHGGSVGAVKVLQGRSRHRVWSIENGQLVQVGEELVQPGQILSCGPNLIHSMADDGAEDPLMTLHLYTASIDFMVIYQHQPARSHVVDGNCGAWIPTNQPELIRRSVDGIVRRRDLFS